MTFAKHGPCLPSPLWLRPTQKPHPPPPTFFTNAAFSFEINVVVWVDPPFSVAGTDIAADGDVPVPVPTAAAVAVDVDASDNGGVGVGVDDDEGRAIEPARTRIAAGR